MAEQLNTRKEDIPVVFDYGYIFCTEVKITTISFVCGSTDRHYDRNYESQITLKQVYQIPSCFDKIYFGMTDLEKKEFFRNLKI